jgi:hypothetical protein
MRCPKCGYHSFDDLDSCKKCGVDLTEQKLRFKYQGYVAPSPGEELAEPEPAVAEIPEEAEAESEAIDFGFDILDEVAELSAGDMEPPAIADRIDAEDQIDDPFAIDLTADSGLSLDQPFAVDDENVPDDELPKLDDVRFNF